MDSRPRGNDDGKKTVPRNQSKNDALVLSRTLRALLANPLAAAGLVIIAVLIIAAALAPLLSPHDPLVQNLGGRLAPPGGGHWLGTDELGRDIASRLMWGARTTLVIIALVTVLSAPLGLVLGCAAGTLGGWGLAVSRYSKHPALAADLARHLTSEAEQIRRAIAGAFNPTRPAVYRNAAVLTAHPFMGSLSELMDNAVVRPSRIAGERYNQFSSIFWNAVHDILSGRAAAADSLAAAERRLRRLSRNGRW